MKIIFTLLVISFSIIVDLTAQEGKTIIKNPKQPGAAKFIPGKTTNSKNKIDKVFTTGEIKYPISWDSGNITDHLINKDNKEDYLETTVQPGTYSVKIEIKKIGQPRGIKSGQLKIRIHGDEWCATSGFETFNHGTTIREVHVPGSLSTDKVSRGKITFEFEREGRKTNVNYKVSLNRISTTLMTRIPGMPIGYLQVLTNDQYSYYPYTLQTYHKIKKNKARIKINKVNGRARTTCFIYLSDYNQIDLPKTLHTSFEFPQGNQTSSRELVIPNARGKYIFLRLENHSTSYRFFCNGTIEQF